MQIGNRLETLARHVPQGVRLADIGTDHAYLPVFLLQRGYIEAAVAGDIAEGPCMAARNTVAQYGLKQKIEIRQGSGLRVIHKNEVDCVTIAGMGGSTMIEILEDDMDLSLSIPYLILQPMAGASGLRKWLLAHGWKIIDEDLVDDDPHFYEIICAVPRKSDEQPAQYTEAELVIGPTLLEKGHALLAVQIERQKRICSNLLAQMNRSDKAKASDKYKELTNLFQQLEQL